VDWPRHKGNTSAEDPQNMHTDMLLIMSVDGVNQLRVGFDRERGGNWLLGKVFQVLNKIESIEPGLSS